MKRNGFDIEPSSGSGKACKGCNKTATIQVREPTHVGYLLRKSFRFTVGDKESLKQATEKALKFADTALPL